MKKCMHCKQFILFDNMFGYCKKYNTQTLINENCKIIKKKVK